MLHESWDGVAWYMAGTYVCCLNESKWVGKVYVWQSVPGP